MQCGTGLVCPPEDGRSDLAVCVWSPVVNGRSDIFVCFLPKSLLMKLFQFGQTRSNDTVHLSLEAEHSIFVYRRVIKYCKTHFFSRASNSHEFRE